MDKEKGSAMTSTTEQAIQAEADRANALQLLQRNLTPGDTVYLVLREWKRNGDRSISLLALARTDINPEGLPALWNISGHVHHLTGWRSNEDDDDPIAIVTDTQGMDAGAWLVYCLGRYIWPDGYDCSGEGACNWNEHHGIDMVPYGGHHEATGYALRYRWI